MAGEMRWMWMWAVLCGCYPDPTVSDTDAAALPDNCDALATCTPREHTVLYLCCRGQDFSDCRYEAREENKVVRTWRCQTMVCNEASEPAVDWCLG